MHPCLGGMVVLVVEAVTLVEWWWRLMMAATVVGGGEARGGACVGGSGRSGDKVHFWSWPEYSPENYSGGGWPKKGGDRRWGRGGQIMGEGERHV
ncbi:hypothetical protein Tco_0210430 [Tanacetum coccineum]